MRNVRQYLPAVVLAAGCALVFQTRSQRKVPLAGPLKDLLPSVPGYTTRDQRVSDEERKVAGMTDYVARAYVRDSALAFTTLVSYYDRQAQGSTIHSPRNCLPGAGWEILRGGTKQIEVDGARHVVNEYILKNGVTTAIAYYWYQGRGRVVASEYQVKWNLLRDAALLGHTEEALVRVVVYPSATRTPSDSIAVQASYSAASKLGELIAADLMRDVSRVLPGIPRAS